MLLLLLLRLHRMHSHLPRTHLLLLRLVQAKGAEAGIRLASAAAAAIQRRHTMLLQQAARVAIQEAR